MQSKPAMIIDLWVTRHGQTESNVKKLIAGHRGDHLTKLGKQQAQKLCFRLSKLNFDKAYVSDLSRTRETAEPLVKLCPTLPVTYTKLLRQKGGGQIQGKPLSITAENARKLGISIKEYCPKGGQSWNDVFERVRKFITLLFLQHINQQSKSVLVITHGGWIMEFQNFLKAIRKSPRNAINNTKNTAVYNVIFSLSQDSLAALKSEASSYSEVKSSDIKEDEQKKGQEKHVTKSIGVKSEKVAQEIVKLLQGVIDFDVKLLNDDSHLEDGVKK